MPGEVSVQGCSSEQNRKTLLTWVRILTLLLSKCVDFVLTSLTLGIYSCKMGVVMPVM